MEQWQKGIYDAMNGLELISEQNRIENELTQFKRLSEELDSQVYTLQKELDIKLKKLAETRANLADSRKELKQFSEYLKHRMPVIM